VNGLITLAPRFAYPFSSPLNFYGVSLEDVRRYPDQRMVERYNLEIMYIENKVRLKAISDLENANTLGDYRKQSIVHFRVGILPDGKQARVTFKFSVPAGFPNKTQIFDDNTIKDNHETPGSTDEHWVHTSRSCQVVGDGSRIINVYFRPTRYSEGSNDHVLYFNDVEIVEV